MQDLSQESWRTQRDLQDQLAEVIGSFGYRTLETPILEPTDLFLRKSGGELASRIYSFTDPGSNPVSLRPEFTSSIMRHYLENASETSLPARWQYAGPVFRYDASQPDSSGQFIQFGAELVGSASILADVEVLNLASQVLQLLKVEDWRLELADLDVLNSILDAVGVSERARTFIVVNIPLLSAGRQAIPQALEEARRLHITSQSGPDDLLALAVSGLDDSQARVALRSLLQWTAADRLGQRSPEEVVERLLRKLRGSDAEASLERGLELASDLATVKGEPNSALKGAHAVVRKAQADGAAFQRLTQLMDLALSDPSISGHLALNFGLVRGLAYYNGIVFEVKHPAWPESLGGGGRYDGLARALGSPEVVPALGFAYNLDALQAVSAKGDYAGNRRAGKAGSLVVSVDAESQKHALSVVKRLREGGTPAELDVDSLDLSQAQSYASRKGLAQVILVNPDGTQESHAVE